MNHLQTQAVKIAASNALLAAFADKFGDKLPEGLAGFSKVSDEPRLFISTGWNDADRQRSLALVGEVFGREGWTQELSYDRKTYNWKREVDGVQVHINSAEIVPVEKNDQPVHPAKFPLQLTDTPLAQRKPKAVVDAANHY